jgi:kynurenine formamidase
MSATPEQYRVQFDFEIAFTNGGGLSGRGFRLDASGPEMVDDAIAAALVAELRLLMVETVQITNRRMLRERHKRDVAAAPGADAGRRLVDLSHPVEQGMTTYPGLPAPVIIQVLTREASRERYAPGTEFQIDRIDLCGNTGTYIDSPFHRYADGVDLAELPLERLAGLPGVRIDLTGAREPAIHRQALLPYELAGHAVLLHTGWDRHWRTDAYGAPDHPHLAADAVALLVGAGVALVGIDSVNIDGTSDGERPAHSGLLAAGIPVCEHLTNLGALPSTGFRFSAVPAPVRAFGTFPVRAFAEI